MVKAGIKRTVQTVKYSPTKGRAISWTTASCGSAHRSAHCRRNVGMCRPTEEHQLNIQDQVQSETLTSV